MTEAEYNAALDEIERRLSAAYIAQASALRGTLTLQQIGLMVASGNLLALDRSYENARYNGFLEVVRSAYLQGGTAEGGDVFDIRRPSAQRWLDNQAQSFLTAQTRAQGSAIQLTVQAGRARGDQPRDIAEALIGPKSPMSGQRVGGVMGLSGQDVEWIENARAQLLSNDPSMLRDYLTRVRRDRRFDGYVQRAIDSGQRIPRDTVDRMIQRYSERLLVTRTENVATINALEAYNAGRQQYYEQLVEDGVPRDRITKRWKSRGDEKVRATHRLMNGQKVLGDGFFITPRGARMKNPGDMSGGAGLAEVARCRCRAIYKIAGEDDDDLPLTIGAF